MEPWRDILIKAIACGGLFSIACHVECAVETLISIAVYKDAKKRPPHGLNIVRWSLRISLFSLFMVLFNDLIILIIG